MPRQVVDRRSTKTSSCRNVGMFKRHDHGTPPSARNKGKHKSATGYYYGAWPCHAWCMLSELWLAGGNLSSSRAEIPSPRLIYKYTNKQIKKQKRHFLIPPSETTKRSGSNETVDAMAVALTRRDETGREGQPRADRRYELEGKVGSRASPSRACVRPVVHMAGPHLPVMSLPFDLIFALTNAPTVSLHPRFPCQTLLLRRTTAIFYSVSFLFSIFIFDWKPKRETYITPLVNGRRDRNRRR